MKKKNRICILHLMVIGFALIFTASCNNDEDTKSPKTGGIVFNPNLTYGNVSDINGNVYRTITIGTQTWMAENLRTTKYRNGDTIGTTKPATLDITSESTPKYQWAYDGNENKVATYGRLYTWYTITDSRNVCPTGWHIPTDANWTTLTTYLGGESLAGGLLKETGTTHWWTPNAGTTNESGFTALPSGYRDYDGSFYSINFEGNWWSSTMDSPYSALYRGMFFNDTEVFRNSYYTNEGFSVRCLKN